MRKVDLYFLLVAAFCLVSGVTLGLWMGIHHDFQLAPVHAHINLVGWASLALFGLAYRAYPALAQSRLAAVHFALSATGAVMMPTGVYFSITQEQPALATVGGTCWLAGAILFLFTIARAVSGGAGAAPQAVSE